MEPEKCIPNLFLGKGVISGFEKLCSPSMFPYLQNEVIIASKVDLTEFLKETCTSSKVIYKAFHTFLISHCDTRVVSLNDRMLPFD